MKKVILIISLAVLQNFASSQVADPQLSGFKLVAESRVSGEFEGADYDKSVQLDNGMVFKFNEYHYHYSYRPKALVYSMVMSISEQKRIGIKNPTGPLSLYRLYINNRSYKVFRVR